MAFLASPTAFDFPYRSGCLWDRRNAVGSMSSYFVDSPVVGPMDATGTTGTYRRFCDFIKAHIVNQAIDSIVGLGLWG